MTRIRPLETMILLFAMTLFVGIFALAMLGSANVKDLKLPRPVLTDVPGLKPEHHGELSRINVLSARFDELRKEYEDDPVAQQQIDVYDPVTEYHERLKGYCEALRSNDREKIAELESWFEEYYPDIH